MQTLLLPDPRPLVEELGQAFFRSVPECAGVYLMRGEGDQVLYVGKAKNLRSRLRSYRVANPDRVARRHLRLMRAVRRIDLEACVDEAAALKREGELLRALRPRYNRAGTWPLPQRYLAWRVCPAQNELECAVVSEFPEGWRGQAKVGGGAALLRDRLMRLLFCAMNPERGWMGLPVGWAEGVPACARVPVPRTRDAMSTNALVETACCALNGFFGGETVSFAEWIWSRCGVRGVFEAAAIEAELCQLRQWCVIRNKVPQ